MIKGLPERGISKDYNVKVRPQPGCTTEDIEDHIKPIIRKNPDAIIIHSGTNGATNDKPTKKKIKKVVKLIEDANPDIQVIISRLIHQEDRDVNDEIACINNQLESYCNSKKFLFINNNNMKSSCLAKDKLHLNKTENSIFAKNIISVSKKLWYSTKHVEQVNGASFSDASTTSPEYDKNIDITLKRLRHSHVNNVVFSYLSINYIRNKFGDLDKIVDGNIDILCIAEKKLDESFPNNQFVLVGYHLPYRIDITAKKGSLMVFVKSHIPSRRLNDFKIPSNIQIIPFEINLRKKMVSCINIPGKQKLSLTNLLEFYSTRYEKIIVLGDFNIEAENKVMKDFLQEHTF